MIYNALINTIEKFPDKTAIVYESQRISYKDLYNHVVGLSTGLRSIGIKQGDCIAIILPNCPEFIISFFAAAKLNTVMLPINPALVEEEYKFYINESNAAAIITDAQHADACHNVVLRLNKKISIIVTNGTHASDMNFYNLIKNNQIDYDKPQPFEGDMLYQYSSGSTGRPKRVCKTQKNLYHEIFNFTSTATITSADNILCAIPLFHAHGLGNCMLTAAYTGATHIIMEDIRKNGVPVKVPFVLRRPRLLELIEKEQVTVFPGVPFIYSALADTPHDFQANILSLRLCFSAGNFLPVQTFKKFAARFKFFVTQMYGCTEAGSISINLEKGEEGHYDSVGFPMKNVDVRIVDDEGNVIPCGSIGEIIIKSEALTNGYFNMPELNIEAFRDGYFFTGDLGKKDAAGRLYITGRKKIFIDTGGNKVDPLEIEDVLHAHPKVQEAVVVGMKSPFEGELIKAVLVVKESCSDKEIISFCRDKLAYFKLPQVVEFRDEIPKSPLGKILRKDLI